MTKEESKLSSISSPKFGSLMAKSNDIDYSVFINKSNRGNVDVNLHYQRDFVGETPVKIISTPNHKIVRGCDGGGYLEVNVHEQ